MELTYKALAEECTKAIARYETEIAGYKKEIDEGCGTFLEKTLIETVIPSLYTDIDRERKLYDDYQRHISCENIKEIRDTITT